MSKDIKIYDFDFGTVKEEKEIVKLEIDNTQFDRADLLDLKETVSNLDMSSFLELTDVKEAENEVFYYFKRSNVLKNLTQIKNEAYPVKISIAEKILTEDILQKFGKENLYVSLNPSTLYYHPMQTVKYTYVANNNMPTEQKTAIERYKACVVSILTDISYEKCLETPNEVEKQTNNFIEEIYNQSSVAELLTLIQQSNDYITYDYISSRQKNETKTKRNALLVIGGITLLFAGGVFFALNRTSNIEETLTAQYTNEVEAKDTVITAYEEFTKGNIDEALNLYQSVDYDSEVVAQQLFNAGQYQQAIETDENFLEQVIQELYTNGEQEQITELNDEKLSEETKSKLDDEKAIVSGDINIMVNVLNFLDDEHTAVRLARKFVEQNDFNNAKAVLEKYPEKTKVQEIIEIADQIQAKQEERDNLAKNEEENEDNNIEEQQKQLEQEVNELRNQLNEYIG
jgi:hypothetical protein